MNNLITSTLVLMSSLSFAQNKIIGYVTEQNSGKKPVENVLIKSVGANSITSSNKGDFVLTYQGLETGTNVIVRAEKDGWEIVNDKEMNTFIPANLNKKPLKIIVCKSGTLAKAKSKYYETFEENLYNEFTRLKVKYKDNQKELIRLEEDYTRTQKQLNDFADEYSRINLDDASEMEIEAIELFKAGKYEEFIELKKSIVTEADADKAIKNKHKAAKITANADSTLSLYFKSQKEIANTQIFQLKYKEAEQTLRNIIKKDTTNFESHVYFAKFIFEHGKSEIINQLNLDDLPGLFELQDSVHHFVKIANLESYKWYENSLHFAKSLEDSILIFNNLGILNVLNKNYKAAKSQLDFVYENFILKKSNTNYFYILDNKISINWNQLGKVFENAKKNISNNDNIKELITPPYNPIYDSYINLHLSRMINNTNKSSEYYRLSFLATYLKYIEVLGNSQNFAQIINEIDKIINKDL